MRTATIVLALVFAGVTLVPSVAASHCCGPCTHEWVEILLEVPGDYSEGGFSQSLGNAGSRAGGCLDNGIGWDICEIVGCDVTLP